MDIILYDSGSTHLYPITLTRASFDIFCGGTTLFDAVAELFPKSGIDVAVPDALAGITRLRHTTLRKPTGDVALLLDGSIVPDRKALAAFVKGLRSESNAVFKTRQGIVGALLPTKELNALSGADTPAFLSKQRLKRNNVRLSLFQKVWEPIIYNEKILAANLEMLPNRGMRKHGAGVFLGKNVSLGEQVVFDATKGPIVIGEGATIRPFAYLRGPVYVGSGSIVNEFSSIKDGACIGPVCKVGGEVEGSVIAGYSNKQHYGFLGASWVGEWVNIGGGATNSNLKNTYGTVVMSGEDTGEQFLGCVIGDYSKIAVGSTIMTGKVIGVNSNVLGMVTRDVPSFANYLDGRAKHVEFDLGVAHRIQKAMFSRRGQTVTTAHRALLETVFNQTREERKKAGIKKGAIKL